MRFNGVHECICTSQPSICNASENIALPLPWRTDVKKIHFMWRYNLVCVENDTGESAIFGLEASGHLRWDQAEGN